MKELGINLVNLELLRTLSNKTCITTPCKGTMCTVPNHLCSKDITIK